MMQQSQQNSWQKTTSHWPSLVCKPVLRASAIDQTTDSSWTRSKVIQRCCAQGFQLENNMSLTNQYVHSYDLFTNWIMNIPPLIIIHLTVICQNIKMKVNSDVFGLAVLTLENAFSMPRFDDAHHFFWATRKVILSSGSHWWTYTDVLKPRSPNSFNRITVCL